jgi:hypothetical protein
MTWVMLTTYTPTYILITCIPTHSLTRPLVYLPTHSPTYPPPTTHHTTHPPI